VGMDEYIIDSHFTKIGRSFNESEQFLNSTHNFEPVGELGIGVLSYFMIADKVTIETARSIDNSLIIEIDNISDYFFVRQGKREGPGTVVTLDLNKDFKYDSLAKLIETFATHIEFPVEVFDSDGKNYLIKNRINFSFDFSDKYHDLVFPVNNVCFSGYFGVFANKSKNNPFAIYHVKKLEQNYISLEGILVSSNDKITTFIMPSWIRSNLVDFDINIMKGVVDLNVARNGIISNEKLTEFKKTFEKELIAVLIRLIDENKAKILEEETDINYSEVVYTFF